VFFTSILRRHLGDAICAAPSAFPQRELFNAGFSGGISFWLPCKRVQFEHDLRSQSHLPIAAAALLAEELRLRKFA
jgi:hypothetical protein